MNILAPLGLFSLGITGAVVLPTISVTPESAPPPAMAVQREAGEAAMPRQDPSAPLSIILLTTREVDAALPRGQVRVPAGTAVRLDLDRGSEVDVRFAGAVMTVPRDVLLNNGPVLRPREIAAAAPTTSNPSSGMRVNTAYQPPTYDAYPSEDNSPTYAAYDERRSSRSFEPAPRNIYVNNSSAEYNINFGDAGQRRGGGGSCGISCTPSMRQMRRQPMAHSVPMRRSAGTVNRARINRGGHFR